MRIGRRARGEGLLARLVPHPARAAHPALHFTPQRTQETYVVRPSGLQGGGGGVDAGAGGGELRQSEEEGVGGSLKGFGDRIQDRGRPKEGVSRGAPQVCYRIGSQGAEGQEEGRSHPFGVQRSDIGDEALG